MMNMFNNASSWTGMLVVVGTLSAIFLAPAAAGATLKGLATKGVELAGNIFNAGGSAASSIHNAMT